jgi:hypothetical protein
MLIGMSAPQLPDLIPKLNPTLQDSHIPAPDLRAAVKVAGSDLDYTYSVSPGVKLRMAIDVSGNVAVVRSYALDSQNPVKMASAGDPEHPQYDTSDYYYAWGLSSGSSLTLESGRFAVGGAIRKNTFNSISSITSLTPSADPRMQGLELTDSKSSQEIWVSYDLGKSFKVRFFVSQEKRSGISSGGAAATETETIRGGNLIYQF